MHTQLLTIMLGTQHFCVVVDFAFFIIFSKIKIHALSFLLFAFHTHTKIDTSKPVILLQKNWENTQDRHLSFLANWNMKKCLQQFQNIHADCTLQRPRSAVSKCNCPKPTTPNYLLSFYCLNRQTLFLIAYHLRWFFTVVKLIKEDEWIWNLKPTGGTTASFSANQHCCCNFKNKFSSRNDKQTNHLYSANQK